jgi:hypothetical protein
MIFTTLNGSKKRLSKPKKYIIKWDNPSRSKRQYKVKQFLKEFWSHDFVFEEFPMAGTKLSFDFYNSSKNIMIEVQGEQHLKHTPFFHGKAKSKFVSQIRRDNDKLNFCKLNEIPLVEVYPKDEISKELFYSFGITL